MESKQMLASAQDRRSHWEGIYLKRPPTEVSWYQPQARTSLAIIQSLGLPVATPVVDVGGGASPLVDGLVDMGFTDLSVLDVSAAALDAARRRLGSEPAVRWLELDLLEWQPEREYGLWHDRAVFHFLTEELDRIRYVELMKQALRPGGYAVLATFAPDGPQSCSGLAVRRYAAPELSAMLEPAGLQTLEDRREEHQTPGGQVQPFTWIVAKVPH